MSKLKPQHRPKTQTWADVYKPTEEVVQQSIAGALRSKRARVLSTVHRVKKCSCPGCGMRFYPPAVYGADKGVPDLLARRNSWQVAGWMGIEVKGPKTPLSPEQRVLEQEGAIIVVRSPAEALKALEDFENSLED